MKHSPLSIFNSQLIGFLALTLLTSHVFAQQRPIVKYTVREGLVQNQVLSLLKDSRGYVWCGTWYGLSRFNGETFENYTREEGFASAGVNDIVEDNDGYIWALCGKFSLFRFDGKTFKKYNLSGTNAGRIIHNSQTNAIQILASAAVDPAKFELLEVKGDTLLPAKLPNFPKGKLISAHFHSLTSAYILNIDNRLLSYRAAQTTLLAEISSGDYFDIIQNELHLHKILLDGDRQHYMFREGKFVPFLRFKGEELTVLRPLTYPFVFVNQNSLYYLPPNTLKAERVGESPPGLAYSNFLNQKMSSTLWIPTEKGLWGLMLTGFKNFQQQEVPNAWSVVEDDKGEFLFLNYWKDLQKYDGEKLRNIPSNNYLPKAVKSYKPLKTTPGPNSWYFRALRDQKGTCWLPDGAGLYRYREGSWDFIRQGYSNLPFCIAEDKLRQKIVCASVNHFYTADIDPPFRTDSIRGTSRLFENLIFCTVVAPTGEYWFSGYGIERYNPDTKKFTSYTLENSKLPMKGSYMLYHDWSGRLWAGGDAILTRYNPEKESFEKVFDFPFHRIIQFVEQIDSTHLMVADMQNLYVLNLKKFNATGEVDIKTFNHHNGFMGMEPGQLGSYRDSKGRIWITSSSVLSVLDPKQLDLTTRPLRTMISRVNKQGVSFIHPDELVEVPEGESIINIKVETLGDDKPYNSQFSYWLEGEMDGWTDWQEQPLITLNNLPNGVHTLKVRSRSGDFNAHNASIATLRFRTQVAMWKSPDFYKYASLAGLLLVIALALLWRRDARKGRALLAQQSQLEKRERTLRLLQAQTIHRR